MADPYPNAPPLPSLPAHPRCRCTIRAVYRDPDGKVIGTPNEQAPKLPTDAMGGGDPPTVPPAVGDWQKALGTLSRLDSAGMRNPENRSFWRSLGKLDDDQITAIAAFGKTNTAGHKLTGQFLQIRYGITLGKPTGWNADLRFATIRALERIRAINPAYVVDSTKFLHTIGDRPPGARRFGSSVIARAFASGQIEGNMKLWAQFGGPNGRKLRAGAHVNAAEEVILHEFMHSVHSRFGLHDPTMVSRLGGSASRNPYAAVEAVDRSWHEAYEAIRRKSRGVAPDDGAIGKLEESIAKFQGYVDDPTRAYARKYNEEALARQKKALAELRAAIEGTPDHEYFPTEYGQGSYAEDFAESGMLFFLNPERLKKFAPERYEFMRDRVFGGKEP